MGTPLRVLIIEDVERDAALLVRELKRGGFDVTSERVETEAEMTAALERRWDVVISDYALPQFSAPRALALIKERGLDTPFIIVSGTVDEETAGGAIRAGAHDFMAKGRYARMTPAIERALRDAELRAERLRMQEQLVISDRMASVGTLAAGVAHEINNPLAALMANLEYVADDIVRLEGEIAARAGPSQDPNLAQWLTTRRHEISEPLRDSRESAERVRLIVRDMRMFSQSDEQAMGAVDVKRVIDSSVRMAWNEIRHRAKLVTEYGDVPPVEGNEGRLGQVFLNLIVNAAQAMPDGHADENEIRIVTRRGELDRVVVEVRDTGSGIPATLLSRIFDPFFTTKPIGTGTGLGLAICHRLVSERGGAIQVESVEGKGTVFRVSLPTAKPVEAPAQATAAVSPARKGKLLVIDDEHAVGVAIRRLFRGEHDVVALTSGRDAVDRLSAGDQFDVILCDLMMPEMTGMELYAEVLRIAPEEAKKLVFMTGGAFTSGAREFLRSVPNENVEKPFDGERLRRLVQAMLQPK